MKYWQTARRAIALDRPLVMAILNVTPDSFSDGGQYTDPEACLRRAEQLVAEGADVLDIGGESTRPGARQVSVEVEIERVIPVIKCVAKRLDIPISIDTTKASVARAAIDAGAEIVNDISGLRFDLRIAEVAADARAGLVLMHSRGTFETMHTDPPTDDVMSDVVNGLRSSLGRAIRSGVEDKRIVLDIGIGFGKTLDQNLELLGNIDKLVTEFHDYPLLVGVSRKSFIGKLLGDRSPKERLSGSIAAAVLADSKGATILRVHDVRETVDSLRVAIAILEAAVK
jgi:dihydropteroate synthase